MPYLQHMYNGATLRVVVRSATDATALGGSSQRKARERSPEVSVRLTTMNALLASLDRRVGSPTEHASSCFRECIKRFSQSAMRLQPAGL